MSLAFEANFDGLVGPTHHYAGLSVGNIASTRNAKQVSQPKKAALQGLAKAAMLRDLGLKQGVLPPLRRPRLDTLRALGLTGSDTSVVEKAFKAVPQVLSACYSASSMWVANAGTFSPSSDAGDRKVHFTAANLSSKFHRSLEPKQTGANFRSIFTGDSFVHHDPVLPQFGDEGAANHGRFTSSHGEPGIELFVFGGSVLQEASYAKPKRFQARQTVEASHAIATHHGLDFKRMLLVQQNPEAIDAGVFHNDVASVANENVFFLHERAFLDQPAVLAILRQSWAALAAGTGSLKPLKIVEVPGREVSLEDAVKSYLFNSQLVSIPSSAGGASAGKMALICPEECRETDSVRQMIDRILEGSSSAGETPIAEAHYLDVRESMQNGGGPACLRLRVVLTPEEEKAVHPKIWLTTETEAELAAWIGKHYRDRLEFDDLRDPKLFLEVQAAMDDLEKILGLPLA